MDKNTKWTIGVSAAIITIFIISLYAFGGKNNDTNSNENQVGTSTEKIITTDNAYSTGLNNNSRIVPNKTEGLSVVDQLAGDLVAFSNVNFDGDTWVLVYEDKDGEPSNLLGAGLFFKGTTEGESPVLRKIIAGKKYYVTYVKDNGNKVFDLMLDKPNETSPVVSFLAK